MAEILHFEILRKHGQTRTNTDKHTHKHTNKQTDMGITIPRPPPMGGEVTMVHYIYIYISWRNDTPMGAALHRIIIYLNICISDNQQTC